MAHLRTRELVQPQQHVQQFLRQRLDRRVVQVPLGWRAHRSRLHGQPHHGGEPPLRLTTASSATSTATPTGSASTSPRLGFPKSWNDHDSRRTSAASRTSISTATTAPTAPYSGVRRIRTSTRSRSTRSMDRIPSRSARSSESTPRTRSTRISPPLASSSSTPHTPADRWTIQRLRLAARAWRRSFSGFFPTAAASNGARPSPTATICGRSTFRTIGKSPAS